MNKINQHGIGRKSGDSPINYRLLRLAFQPVQCEAEENNGTNRIDETLRAELVIGVGQIQKAVALALHCVVAAVHIVGDAYNIEENYARAEPAQQGDKLFPIHCCQTATYKNKQIMQRQII